MAAAAALLLAVACATGSGGSGDVRSGRVEADTARSEDRAVRIVVDNQIRQSATVVVYLVTDAGSRHRLGRAPPGQEKAFRYEPRQGERGRRFHLEADTTFGDLYRSDSFSFAYVAELRWIVRR